MEGQEMKLPTFGDDSWAEHGGYMNAKINKLEQQFLDNAKNSGIQKSNLFSGISIYVNGHTNPTAEALKIIMMEHGGVYHTYERPHTTFIIASNLPDVKVRKMMPSKTIIKPEWIVDCLKENRILDHKKYLYNFNHKVSQPKLAFGGKNEDDTKKARTAVNPNFLSEFYSNSRLHHISTLGLALKDYVNDLREKHQGDFPGRMEIMLPRREISGNTSGRCGKVIMHIDMDCFFVSVGLRSRPHLRGLPVAVTHSKGGRRPNSSDQNCKDPSSIDEEVAEEEARNIMGGSVAGNKSISLSEIASCSYEARKKGIKNGMFMGAALKLCPDLKTIPYDFVQYKEVSYILYDSIARYTLDIEAVSLGIGENRLLARLATRKAKPDGQYFFPQEDVTQNIAEVSLRDLPGVGRSTCEKFRENGWITCGDLQSVPLSRLQRDFGSKSGENLFNLCRGQDTRPLNFSRQRKSVSTEVNYGIRFTKKAELETFLRQLSEETSRRLREVAMKGKSVTLKLMIRAHDAPVETPKFMGHGLCDHVAKSTQLPAFSDDPDVIFKAVWKISEELAIAPEELRGIGIQVTKLNKAEAAKSPQSSSLVNLFKQMQEKAKNEPHKNLPAEEKKEKVTENLPERPELDPEVLKALPDELREEILRDYTEWRKAQGASHVANSQMKVSPPLKKRKLEMNPEPAQTTQSPVKMEKPKSKPNPISSSNILGKENWMRILTKWVNSGDAPKACDVQHLSRNACEFIRAKDICNLYSQLEYLFLIIDQKDNCAWHESYRSIASEVQHEMLLIYEIKLKIKENVSCKECSKS
uniref:DNA repair protein REV1 n=1 Tax=Lutzomyia longipalpis TaxID=7200 RepID=A0A1B0CQB0_LUTLO